MIVGSFPIGKFSDPKRRHEIKNHEIDFFFGGEKNLLWKILGEIFEYPVANRKQIISLLEKKGLAVGDVIKSCKRKKGRAGDSDLLEIDWNKNLLHVLEKENIRTVFFTSKKVEMWFNKLFPDSQHLKKITLISPSGQSVRSLHLHHGFNDWQKAHPYEKRIRFIIEDYRKKFETIG